ncbi:O-antigen ligase family protein [Pontibacter vulgaris]|uniref:O-antigen ligase family protein n=1 Tax=Pontibacter vulgaris TaxID=2905679 RepID=UPI001FA71276|nr:O-antigen ligase family protein [Pontibacter vulgaris]
MIKVASIRKQAQNKCKNAKRQHEWGFILTILAIASVFLGSSVISIDFSFFSLYPLRFLCFIGLFFMMSRERWRDSFLLFNSRFIVIFLFLGLISIIWAPDTTLAIKEFGILQTGLTLTWLISKYIYSEDRLEVVFKIWIVGALCINLIGIWEVWHQEYLIVTEIGTKTANSIERNGFLAPRAIFANQNNYGFFNALTSLVLLGRVINAYSPKIIYRLNIISLLLSITILFFSYSRAAIFGFILGVIVFCLITIFSNRNYQGKLVRFTIIGAVIFVIIIILNESVVDSITRMLTLVIEKNDKSIESGEEGRNVFYLKSIRYFVDNLGVGMGPGSSIFNLNGTPTHNYLLQVLVEYGPIILLIQMWVVYCAYMRFAKYYTIINNLMPMMLRSTIIVFPLLCFGPSTIMVEGIFWLWYGLVISYSSIVIRKYYAYKLS